MTANSSRARGRDCSRTARLVLVVLFCAVWHSCEFAVPAEIAGRPIVRGVPGAGTHLVFSPDGALLAWATLPLSGKDDDPVSVTFWDIGRQEQRKKFTVSRDVCVPSICFGPTNTTLMLATYTARLGVWNVADGTKIAEYQLPVRDDSTPRYSAKRRQEPRVSVSDAFVFARDGRFGVRSERWFLVGNAKTGTVVDSLDLGTDNGRVGASLDGKWLVAPAPIGRGTRVGATGLQVWSLESYKRLQVYRVPFQTLCVSVSPTGERVVSSYRTGWHLWSLAGGSLKPVAEGMHPAPTPISACLVVAFSPDGAVFTTGCQDGSATVFFWDSATGQLRSKITHEQASTVSSMAFSPDGRWLATTVFDSVGKTGAVYLWDLTSNQEPPSYGP